MRFVLIAILVAACGPARPMNGPSMNNHMNPQPEESRVISRDILARDPIANRTRCKHILIGWRDLEGQYGDHMDERAAERSKADAESLVESLTRQLAGGADFDTLMDAYSEDPGAKVRPEGYWVSPDAELVIEFRALGLRLNVGEVGVTESDYGFHIIKREE